MRNLAWSPSVVQLVPALRAAVVTADALQAVIRDGLRRALGRAWRCTNDEEWSFGAELVALPISPLKPRQRW